MNTDLIKSLIDATFEADAEREKRRGHLGGSAIGSPCERELWYGFRWAHEEKFQGRMLRLFNRGHKEEFRFVDYLRRIGCEVREYSERLMYYHKTDTYQTAAWREITEPPVDDLIENLCEDVTGVEYHIKRAEERGTKLKQWRIADHNDHFSGSLDGMARSVPGLDPAMWVLLEFKTHNTKSFTFLAQSKVEGAKRGLLGVQVAKPLHYAQMQVYMRKRGLTLGLYMAVNKNDDDLYLEFVPLDPAFADKLIEKAGKVIAQKKPPARIGNHPSWHDCKFCDFKRKCHFADMLDRNCRTCVNAEPVEGAQWRCALWQSIIPSDYILKGCDNYKAITD